MFQYQITLSMAPDGRLTKALPLAGAMENELFPAALLKFRTVKLMFANWLEYLAHSILYDLALHT
jgi:hypothetical protein